MVKTSVASPTTPMSPQSFSSRRSSEANGTGVSRRESIVSPLDAAGTGGVGASTDTLPEGRIMSLGAGSGKRRRVSNANAMTYQGAAPELASNPGGSDIVAVLKNRSEAEEVGLGLLGIDEVSETDLFSMALVVFGVWRRAGYGAAVLNKRWFLDYACGVFIGGQAVTHSISRCSTDVVKKNMYQNIIFAGGCALCPGLAKTLEVRSRPQHVVVVGPACWQRHDLCAPCCQHPEGCLPGALRPALVLALFF